MMMHFEIAGITEICIRQWLEALGHSLWQALLVGVLLFIVLRRISVERTSLRYALAVGAMLMVVMLGLGTFAVMRLEKPVPDAVTQTEMLDDSSVVTVREAPVAASPSSSSSHVSDRPEVHRLNLSPILLAGWALGVALMLVRILVQLTGAGRVVKTCHPVTESKLVQLIDRLKDTLAITRPVMAVSSESVLSPAVMGWWRPVILLPASLLTAVPSADLEAILLHELAHIRRYDYLVNFFQMVIEALLFFNPALWWISHQIRLEREACCDAVAVRHSGQRLRYAEILVQWARVSDRPMAGVALALSGKGDSSLVERIRRVALPGKGSGVRFSWLGMMGLFALSGLLLAILWKTTDKAVTLAAQILTPAERIERMNELVETHAPALNPDLKVIVRGQVRTEDDQPLPGDLRLEILSYLSPSHMAGAFAIDPNGRFKSQVPYGRIRVAAYARDWAPTFSKEFVPDPNGFIPEIDLVLTRGYTAQVLLEDPNHQPIPNVTVSKAYCLRSPSGWFGLNQSVDKVTDANGVVQFDHCTDYPAKVTVQAQGWQQIIKNQDITLTPKQNRITLERAKPVTGRVLAQVTGEPIPGAVLRILHREQPSHRWSFGYKSEAKAVTDEHGCFSIATLEEGWTYALRVEADGYKSEVLTQVTPGDQDLEVRLGPAQVIKCKIVGPLDQLNQYTLGQPMIHWESRFANPALESLYENSYLLIDINDHTVTLDDFIGDQIIFRTPRQELKFDLTQGIPSEPVVFDLTRGAVGTRQIRILFTGPPSEPAVQGELGIRYQAEGESHMSRYEQPIEDGLALFELSVPGRINWGMDWGSVKGIKGYWIEPYGDSYRGIEVPAGTDPYEIQVPAYPAGSIYGSIQDVPGRSIQSTTLRVVIVNLPDRMDTVSSEIRTQLSDNRSVEGDTYNLAPLPLGGTYALLAMRESRWILSPPVQLTESHPLVPLDLRFEPGCEVAGRVLDPDGHPMAGVQVERSISTRLNKGTGGYGQSSSDIYTDAEGGFRLPEMNSAEHLSHCVRIKPGAVYQPMERDFEPGSEPLIFTLRRGYTLSGTLVDAQTGWPIPSATIWAEPIDQKKKGQFNGTWISDSKTDEQGRFVFTTLDRRPYRIRVPLGVDVTVNGQDPKIMGGEDRTLRLEATIDSWSQLRSRDPNS